MTTRIALVIHPSAVVAGLSLDDAAALATATQDWHNRLVAPLWTVDACVAAGFPAEYAFDDVQLDVVTPETRGGDVVAIHVKGELDDPNALAYHTVVGGVPDGECATAGSALPWGGPSPDCLLADIEHELAEMRGNGALDRSVSVLFRDGTVRVCDFELCDPVSGVAITGPDGHVHSDGVTPAWWGSRCVVGPLSLAGALPAGWKAAGWLPRSASELGEGGYVSLPDGSTWGGAARAGRSRGARLRAAHKVRALRAVAQQRIYAAGKAGAI